MRLIRTPRLRTAAVAVLAGMLFGIAPGSVALAEDNGEAGSAEDHSPEDGKIAVRNEQTDDSLEYLTIEMEEILTGDISTGDADGEDRLTEDVSLSFEKVLVGYQPDDDNDQSVGGMVELSLSSKVDDDGD